MKKRWLSKNITFLGFTSLFNDIASEIIHPLLPLFIVEVLKKGGKELGIVEGISELTASIFKLISGNLSDKVRERKKLAVFGYLVATLTRPFLGITSNIYQVVVLRFFDRVGKGIRASPRDALISASISKEDLGKAFSFQRAMDHLGAFIGPLFAILLVNYFTIREVFYLSIIPGIISLMCIILFVKEKRIEGGILDKKKTELPFSYYFKLPLKFYLFLFVFFIFTLGNSSDTFIILKAKKEGAELIFVPVLWATLNLVKSVSSLPAGYLADRFSKKGVLILGWLLYSVSYLGFALSETTTQFLTILVVYGLYFGFSEGVERAIISELLPEDRRGTGFGLFYLVQGIGLLLASILFGLIWDYYSVKLPFFISSFLALLSTILLILFV